MDVTMPEDAGRLKTILDAIPIPIFYKDVEGRYLGCNLAYESFFGIPGEIITGKTVHELFHPELAAKYREMDQKLYQNPGRQVYEGTVLDADGMRREVIFHKATFLGPDGRVGGIIGAVLDISELKETKKKLAGAKTSFKGVFDAIPDLVSVVDQDLRIVYSNWQGGFEYVPERVRETDCRCYDAYYPEQGKPCEPCHVLEVFRTGKPVHTEKYNPRIGYLEIHAFPVFDEAGRVVMTTEYLRNVTLRKKAADDLRQANRLLESIVSSSPLAIIAFDTEINLTLWNHAAAEMFGWSAQEVLGKPYPLVPEDRLEELRRNMECLHKGEVRRNLETYRRRKDGTLVEVSLSTAVMPDPDGRCIGYMAIMSDITENKRAQRELKESETNYRTIFDAANDAMFVLDADTARILDVNSKLCEMYGYARDEALLLNIGDLSSGVPPYTQANATKLIRGARSRSRLFEWVARDRSGRHFWVEVNIKGIMLGGRLRALAVVRDITEKKVAMEALRESEERFRHIFEEGEDAAFILTPESYLIVDANAAAVRLCGHPKKELRRNSPALFLTGEEFARFAGTLSGSGASSAKNRGFRMDQLELVSRSGKVVTASVRGKVIRSQGEDYFYCTFRDITEKLKLKEEKKRFEEKLLQANKMTALGTLSSGIAHEINNPNNCILSSSQFLREAWKDIGQILAEYARDNGEYSIGGLPDAEAAEVIPRLLANLEEGSGRIKNIVENLKSFARQDREPSNATVDVNMAVKAAVGLLGNQIGKYTENFFQALEENLPKVQGSFQQIEQVILNLTINALQSLPDRNSGVFLSTLYDREARQLLIRVRDQGRGVPPELLSRIMEPFFTTKHDRGGTGLGLSICYSIVKKHQGTIECESDLDTGTTFTVRLPAKGAP